MSGLTQFPSIPKAISSNLLDQYYFDTLREHSKLLTRYQTLLTALTPGFSNLLEDLFYLLYKIEPVLLPVPTSGHAVISALQGSYTLDKLRGRTAGSTTESYLALKLMVDELLLRLRGTEIPAHLESLSSALDALKETEMALKESLEDQKIRQRIQSQEDIINPEDARHLSQLKKPLGLPQDAGLSDIARALAKALKSLAASKEQDTVIKEDGASLSKTVKPKVSDTKKENLEAKLRASLAPDLSAFLEKLDQAFNSEHQVESEAPGDRNQPSDRNGAPMTQEELAEDLSGRAQSLAEKLDASGAPAPPEALMPAGFTAQEMTHGEVDQRRLIEGGGMGDPLSSANLGYAGDPGADARQRGQTPKRDPRSLEQALKQLGERVQRLEGQLAEVLRPLDVQLAVNKTIESIDRFTENVKSLGVNAELEVTDDFDHVLELYRALGEPSAIRFLNKVGKKREIARRAQFHKKRKMQYLNDKVAVGDRFDALIDEEIMALSIEEFNDDFYDRFLNRSLLVYEMEGRVARDRGPIILCYDGSGSMEGVKIEETKALLVAFIEVARIQKRRLITLQFASKTEPLYIQEFNPNHVTIDEIMTLLGQFIRGGTDFETPLKTAVGLLKEDHYRRADILMITDGFSDIREGFKREFIQWKKEMTFKLYAIIIHGETYGDYGDLGEISDEILEIRDRDLSNWNEKISAQLFERI
ncbi:vWA domain-containing protein [Acidaminobacter hydrogenoformans]|uniref:vWA domain-containing protein n=1 Tax=Acidaminobacter hydrogenoformans TaxID=65403 RepID=UPI00147C1E24|nr:VWA domain-containing protein [Acidaminobacter hydrogenoformans]